MINAFVFSGTEVLTTVGSHGSSHGRHGLCRNVGYLGCGSESGHNTRTEHIDCTLQNHCSDCCDRIIQSHRDTNGKHASNSARIPVIVIPAGAQNIILFEHDNKAEGCGNALGNYCGISSACGTKLDSYN